MEDLARIDHGLQPRAGLRRALHGKQQGQQTVLVCRARVFAQSLAQRKMLGLGVRREPRGVGGEKGERRVRVLAVLGEIEVHAADQVPRRVPALQEVLYPAFRFRQFDAERSVQFLPESAKDLRGQILRARSWEAPPGPVGPIPRPAAPGRAPSATPHRCPDGCRGRSRTMRRILSSRRKAGEARSGFSGSELEKTVPRPALESIPQALSKPGFERRRVGSFDQPEAAMRRQGWGKGD